jgi:hypothetical protein
LLPGNYIVRIYRREKDDKRMVVGIVEEVGVREKKGFHCIEELRQILDLPPGKPIRQPRDGGNGGNGGGQGPADSSRVRTARKEYGNGGKEKKCTEE